jgi:hypothetical protein
MRDADRVRESELQPELNERRRKQPMPARESQLFVAFAPRNDDRDI